VRAVEGGADHLAVGELDPSDVDPGLHLEAFGGS